MFSRRFSRIIVNSFNKKRFVSQFIQQKKISPFVAMSLAGISLSGFYFMTITEASSYDISSVKKDIAKAIEDDAAARGNGMSSVFFHLNFLCRYQYGTNPCEISLACIRDILCR